MKENEEELSILQSKIEELGIKIKEYKMKHRVIANVRDDLCYRVS